MCRFLLVLFAVGLSATAQSRTAAPVAANAAHKRVNTPAAKVPDPVIESAIRAKFAKSKISTDKFTVHVQGGVATIEGRAAARP